MSTIQNPILPGFNADQALFVWGTLITSRTQLLSGSRVYVCMHPKT